MTTLERLELSRARLREALAPPPVAPSLSPGHGIGASMLQRLKALPTAGPVIDSVVGWWSLHPLRAWVALAGGASNAVVKPLARRSPLTLVLTAALVGAVFARSRPWRWALKPVLFAGLAPQLAARVAKALPIESWVALLASAPPRQPAQAAFDFPPAGSTPRP
ncbi:MAG: hypothetical protein KGI87_05045 [Burkholderiales bacterium]|nr:hypothetical protein [Burkholderiales bacterium]